MNRKSNHQNLLRTALTTAGTNMTRWAVTLAVVMMTTASALAETTYSYITDLMLIGKNKKSEAETLRKQYVEQGWIAIDQDLNAGAGGDYIYLLYKVGGLASPDQTFITDVHISDASGDAPDRLSHEGRTYRLVPYDGDDHFKEKKGDLNSNAGGDDIHLYYTTDYLSNGNAISSFFFNGTQSDAVGKNGNSTGYSLNSGITKGDKIYMHSEINKAPKWSIEKSSDGGRCTIKGFDLPLDGIEKSAIKVFPSIVCGALVVGVATSLNYQDFPNLETIYLYEEPSSSVMIPMNGCENLQHVHTVDILGNVIKSDELPTSITSIPKRGFENCSALKSLTIPASVTSIADGAFSGCGLTAFTVDKNNPTYQSKNGLLMDKSGKILVAYPCGSTTKEFVIPNGVTSILKGAFSGCTSLKSLTIPGSVMSIESNLFKGHTFLESVIIGNGVTSIGQGAFSGCTGLTNITIGSSVTSIGENTFENCSKLATIHVDNNNPNYKSIDGVLLDKDGKTILLFPTAYPTKNYVIPNGVTNIGGIFTGRKDLTGITIPGSVESIVLDAFKDCTTLESVTIEYDVKSIGQGAFYNCSKLTSITIPGSVTSIDIGAFRNCTSLQSITIPGSVKSIGQTAFVECSSLASVTIENGVESIGQNAFLLCTSLTSLTIPGSVTSIGQSAFSGCDKLASVTIMGNPKIGDGAIPKGVTVTLSLTSNAASGAKWMTFYNDRYNFQADANTTVYKATVIGQSLVLTEVDDRIVNSGTAVILRSGSDPVMTRTATASSDTQANALLGTMEATATPANCFTLSSGPKGVGFYRYTGSEVAAGKAYLIYSGASAAREFIGFDETTGICSIDNGQLTIDNSWYSLDGRKLQGAPAKKGIYVRNGHKVVIK